MTIPPSATTVRPALTHDLPALAAFIARANADPASQSLYCAARSAAGVRSALGDPGDFPGGWERAFVVEAGPGGEITAAFGCQCDPGRTLGWLWGPWAGTAPDGLFDGLMTRLPASLQRLEAFLNVENRTGLRFLQSRGFSLGQTTHIYVRRRAGWTDAAPSCPPLRPAHEVAFARLHAETFPIAASTSADDLLAGRDDEHAIFAATDGLRLLGYVCVSVNRSPREGFIEYLAVKPLARGRGIGGRLLQTAFCWAFEDRRLPQAALCVSDWRGGARKLYEQAGFTLYASGVGARWSKS